VSDSAVDTPTFRQVIASLRDEIHEAEQHLNALRDRETAVITAALEAGTTVRAMADELGMAPMTVWRRYGQNGATRRGRSSPLDLPASVASEQTADRSDTP
jgi:FixJ family two-component response regulator